MVVVYLTFAVHASLTLFSRVLVIGEKLLHGCPCSPSRRKVCVFGASCISCHPKEGVTLARNRCTLPVASSRHESGDFFLGQNEVESRAKAAAVPLDFRRRIILLDSPRAKTILRHRRLRTNRPLCSGDDREASALPTGTSTRWADASASGFLAGSPYLASESSDDKCRS